MLGELLPSTFQGVEYVLEWLIRIGALLVVPFRRTAEATRSWLLLIFFLPIPGLLLYWLIGRPRFPAWRRKRFAGVRPAVEQLVEPLRERAPDWGLFRDRMWDSSRAAARPAAGPLRAGSAACR